MYIKVLMGILLVIFLSGCATPRAGQDVQMLQLQSRISYLEAELQKRNQELQRKNQEIKRLENELEKSEEIRIDLEEKMDYEAIKEDLSQPSIRQIQIALKNSGYYKGSIDSKPGPQTKEAIKAFQKANGLKVDGVVGKVTWSELRKYADER